MTERQEQLPETGLTQRSLLVSWSPPDPRNGLAGAWDKFAGPGSTPAEDWIQLVGVILIGCLAVAASIARDLAGPPLWKLIVAFLIAADLGGGVVTNATSAAKRWYHRPGQGPTQHLAFLSVHIIQIAIVALVWATSKIAYLVVFYVLLLVFGALVVFAPLYLQRPMATLLTSVAVLVSLLRVGNAPGAEWFIPLLFIKLLIAHATTEAPFQPGDSVEQETHPLMFR